MAARQEIWVRGLKSGIKKISALKDTLLKLKFLIKHYAADFVKKKWHYLLEKASGLTAKYL
jgi:hypothetical protein